MKVTEELIEDLINLLQITNIRKVKFDFAMNNTEIPELKLLFEKYYNECELNAQELNNKILSLTGRSDQENSLKEFNRNWFEIKGLLNNKENKAILNAIIIGEHSAIDEYDKVLVNEPYNSELYGFLSEQRFGIQKSLNIIETFNTDYYS